MHVVMASVAMVRRDQSLTIVSCVAALVVVVAVDRSTLWTVLRHSLRSQQWVQIGYQ
jgi:hypothetical protein